MQDVESHLENRSQPRVERLGVTEEQFKRKAANKNAKLKHVTGYVRQYTGRTYPSTCLSSARIFLTICNSQQTKDRNQTIHIFA